ncbi:acetyl-CoA synthetase-like protein [Suillus americanus]|nr:acetyl-CoA synthetase-like protein [Suillus americanus]
MVAPFISPAAVNITVEALDISGCQSMYYKSLFPDLPKVPESNVHHLLFNRPDQREWPDYTLFVNVATGQQHSFREFVEHVRDGATALGADVTQGGLGLCPEGGDLVGILSENCPDYVALLHSLLAITIPSVLFSSYLTPCEFKHANSLTQATRIFASPSLLQLALTSGLPADRIYLLKGENAGYTSFNQLISSAQKNGVPHLPVRHATKDTLAYLMYSSGSSGPSKAVMVSHGNITAATLSSMVNGEEMAKTQAPVGNIPDGVQVSLNALPLFHSMSLRQTGFFNFFKRYTIVMLPKWDIDIFFDSIPKYHITTLHLRPSLLHQLVHHPRFKTVDMKTVKTIESGSTYLPPQLADQVCARFTNMPRVTECYGMTEFITIVMTPIPGMLNGHAKNKPGSPGILLPGVEARVVCPDGSLAGPNEPGELYVRGGSVALGYKGNDKASQETFVDGWVRTGDQIRIDEDEVLFFEDRTTASCTIHKDNSFRHAQIGDMQVSPIEIENTILAQPDNLITDASVAGISGGWTSDQRIPRAWIVLSPAGAGLGEKEWLRGGIEIVEAIPKSPTGKVLRQVLVEGYEKAVGPIAKLHQENVRFP